MRCEALERKPAVEAMRKRRIVHGASLTDFLIFCNKLLSEWLPFRLLPSKTSRAAAWPVAALAVPQAGDIDLAGAKVQGCFQHPPGIALIGILVLAPRTDLARRDTGRPCFGGEEPGALVAVGEIDRLVEEVGSSKGMRISSWLERARAASGDRRRKCKR
jgi:hypothetical protein